MKEKFTNNALETTYLGHQVGLLLNKGMVILLDGDLSAGKTTFTKGIGQALGIKRTINSPTFVILKRYMEDESKLYHIDLYRMDGEGSDFDMEDYIYSDGISVIEWPFNVESLLPKEYLLVKFEIVSEEERKITFIAKGRDYEKVVKYI
ncbi:MAG: tRNA (adenosine(37)-N6)-threonylcarbamoyltransferase complex ATPase subunit type 1 TsaE [Acholeplasmataceae bacterium]|jgi:tRNA threonylcarbamoyladenosine biosynthesis protein TsaE|nr:tRNA (adenosine(37)-N6)-threonylcarbamoyltransferase complex ATPase subunit type 1 TsaE [Acholeplasmataceae bacterium]MDD4204083.1 tRNA (adenosine(37)-N6)-threonylcarbamoyltransferase complex ATPase subunit type 1 TsaE [Acholeplasmataceae bacterium]MDD4468823.1 tRNA (adenosine(37)-N6)-threonylcarbamoyltransferase complex ATPase subunit type 1 TsaE [Acholeplasmataceae bacterium]MDD4824262.1 tRNA (adenosine(37)-N6)-threonylcarbamoyltransferase complex ATPase subunit type 1 TsaE [Acholeplasmatac